MLRVEQFPIRAGADLIDDIGFKIAVDSAGNIFALPSFREKGAETLIWVGRFTLFRKITVRL